MIANGSSKTPTASLNAALAGGDRGRCASRLRPLNERLYGGVAKLLARDLERSRDRAGVEPRLMAFLAGTAALGLLTMKGLVESFGDPLRYSDELLVDGLSRVFEAAARARSAGGADDPDAAR